MTLRYKTPGLLIGALISIVGIISLVIYTWYLKKNKQADKSSNENK